MFRGWGRGGWWCSISCSLSLSTLQFISMSRVMQLQPTRLVHINNITSAVKSCDFHRLLYNAITLSEEIMKLIVYSSSLQRPDLPASSSSTSSSSSSFSSSASLASCSFSHGLTPPPPSLVPTPPVSTSHVTILFCRLKYFQWLEFRSIQLIQSSLTAL